MASIFTEKYANFDLSTGANDGSSEADAWKTPAAVIAGVAAGNRVNIKRQSSAYNLTSSVDFNVSGTALAPIYYRAYTSTIGDGGIWECAYNAGGIADLYFSGNYNYVEGVNYKPGASTNLNSFRVNGAHSWAIRCKADIRVSVGYIANARRCWFIAGSSGAYFNISGGNSYNVDVEECVFQRVGSTSTAYLAYSDQYARALNIRNCVFIGNGNSGEDALYLYRPANHSVVGVHGSRFYNFDDGIHVNDEPTTNKQTSLISRCLFDTMAGYAVKRNAGTDLGKVRIADCFYRACTSGFSNYIDAADLAAFGIEAHSGNPFVDASTFDMEMDTTSGEGQAVRDKEYVIDPTGVNTMKIQPFGAWWKVPSGGSGGGAMVIGG